MSLVRKVMFGKRVKVWELSAVDNPKITRRFIIYLSWYEQHNQAYKLNQLTRILEEDDENEKNN